jgi:hypothetical protein
MTVSRARRAFEIRTCSCDETPQTFPRPDHRKVLGLHSCIILNWPAFLYLSFSQPHISCPETLGTIRKYVIYNRAP